MSYSLPCTLYMWELPKANVRSIGSPNNNPSFTNSVSLTTYSIGKLLRIEFLNGWSIKLWSTCHSAYNFSLAGIGSFSSQIGHTGLIDHFCIVQEMQNVCLHINKAGSAIILLQMGQVASSLLTFSKTSSFFSCLSCLKNNAALVSWSLKIFF